MLYGIQIVFKYYIYNFLLLLKLNFRAQISRIITVLQIILDLFVGPEPFRPLLGLANQWPSYTLHCVSLRKSNQSYLCKMNLMLIFVKLYYTCTTKNIMRKLYIYIYIYIYMYI